MQHHSLSLFFLCIAYGAVANDSCGGTSSICAAPMTTTTPPPASCAAYGCIGYTPGNACQCNDRCSHYNNCCGDYASICAGPPEPTPPPPRPPPPRPPSNLSQAFWQGVDMISVAAVRLKLASAHRRVSYSGLWTAYKTVWVNLPLDFPARCQDKIFEVYSDKCWTPGVEQCGQYKREGDCYNREHSWPKSWWGGKKNDAHSDLFHVYPSDGFVNSKRGNYPYGNVDSPKYTSSDGSKLGYCNITGFRGTCFEPSGKHKGNLARGHFYMALRYVNEFTCCDKEGVDGARIKPWLMRLLLQWHQEDPVEMWEQEFNNRVEALQGNRNPFIDFPSLVELFFS